MTRSSFVTSGRRATEIAFHRILRNATPYVSQASQKIFRMSDDVFVKMYLGYSPPLTRFNDRHPSEWIRPRKKHGACLSVIIFCQGANSIRRRCFRPGPCCGKTHGQCCQYDEISTHPALCRTPTFPVRCMAPMVLLASWMMDGYRTSRTKSQAQGARQFGDTAVTEV